MTSTQLQSMDDVALCEWASRLFADREYIGARAILELVRRFEPHAQAPDHQDYPFIADEENLK